MIGHIGLYVEDLTHSNHFYAPLLKTIGYEIIFTLPQCIAYGREGIPFFEIYTGKPKTTGTHIAFQVGQKEIVQEFYDAALRLGAIDNGAPGYREYAPNYYASFIIDPNGHNLEAFILEAI